MRSASGRFLRLSLLTTRLVENHGRHALTEFTCLHLLHKVLSLVSASDFVFEILIPCVSLVGHRRLKDTLTVARVILLVFHRNRTY